MKEEKKVVKPEDKVKENLKAIPEDSMNLERSERKSEKVKEKY